MKNKTAQSFIMFSDNPEEVVDTEKYGEGFRIVGEYGEWKFGVWDECEGTPFVFIRDLNENDFIFYTVSEPAVVKDPMILSGVWFKCINDEFQDITDEEAAELLCKN